MDKSSVQTIVRLQQHFSEHCAAVGVVLLPVIYTYMMYTASGVKTTPAPHVYVAGFFHLHFHTPTNQSPYNINEYIMYLFCVHSLEPCRDVVSTRFLHENHAFECTL